MSRIRKLYYFDKKNMQEMISFLNNRNVHAGQIIFNPILPLHHLLPLQFKFLPESYVLKENNDIKGLITIAPSKCPIKRLEIQRLFFEENCYDDASELIQFAVSKYKALGACSFVVKVDDNLVDLIRLFISKCGFSQLSYEKLWKIPENFDFKSIDKNYRAFRNSDASTISTLYNESLLPHFRPLLSRDTKEFRETVFKGLSYYSEYKYVIEDNSTKNIFGYILIQTSDNKNFVIDIIQSSWEELDIESIINFGVYAVKKRNKNFNLFIKTKRYTQLGEKYEKLFNEHGFECVQNQVILTNSSAKIIRENVSSKKFISLGQIPENGINVPG